MWIVDGMLVTLKPVIGVRVVGQVALRFLCCSGACLTDVMSCNSGCDLINLDPLKDPKQNIFVAQVLYSGLPHYAV